MASEHLGTQGCCASHFFSVEFSLGFFDNPHTGYEKNSLSAGCKLVRVSATSRTCVSPHDPCRACSLQFNVLKCSSIVQLKEWQH